MEKYRLEQERQKYRPVELLEDPFVSKEPAKPKKILIIALSSVGGLMCGMFIVFIVEYFERMRRQAQRK